MRKKRIIWILLAFFLILLAGIVIVLLLRNSNNENVQLHRAVRSYVREHGESTVTLGELMSFEWDQAIYFGKGQPNRIYEETGVEFKRLGYQLGIIFVKNGEVVYYEYFPQRGELASLDIYPVRLTMRGVRQSVRVFERDDAFTVGRTGGNFGNRLYWLHVIEDDYFAETSIPEEVGN